MFQVNFNAKFLFIYIFDTSILHMDKYKDTDNIVLLKQLKILKPIIYIYFFSRTSKKLFFCFILNLTFCLQEEIYLIINLKKNVKLKGTLRKLDKRSGLKGINYKLIIKKE